jgi:HSP20 family protein
METLIKRKGLSPSMIKKSVDNFLDDFIIKESFDSIEGNFIALNRDLASVNLKEIDDNIEIELTAHKMKNENFKFEIDNDTRMFYSSNSSHFSEEIEKKYNFIGVEFNYRSFCRLPKT